MIPQLYQGALPVNFETGIGQAALGEQQLQLNQEKLIQLKQQRVQQAAKQKLLEEAYKNPAALQQLSAIDPDFAIGIIKTQEFQRGQLDYQASRASQIAEFVDKQPASKKPEAYKQGLAIARQSGLDISGLPEEYSPEVDMQLKAIIANSKTTKQQLEEDKIRAEITRLNAETVRAGREGSVEAGGGATGDLVRAVMRDNPNMNFTDALYLVQTGFRKGTQRGEDGDIVPIQGTLDTSSRIKQAESFGKKTGELTAEKIQNQPKVLSAMESTFAKNDNVLRLIDEIIPKVGQTTAGVGGTLISKLPINSEARDLQKQLSTVIANMGFDELQEMRNNSPTGGALGQVTERELAFLQSVKAYLEQDQSPEQLVKNLERAKKDIIASKNRVKAAYNREYNSNTSQSSTKSSFDGFRVIKVRDK